MILGLQITGVLFALMMIYFAVLHYKKGSLSGLEVVTWTVIWILVMVVCLFPTVFRVYSQTIAVSRLLDLLIAGGFIVTLSLTAASYVRTKRQEKKFEDLVRKLTFRESEKKRVTK